MENQDSNLPPSKNITDLFVDMAVEYWRMSRLFKRLVMKLDAGEQKKYANQLNWFLKKLDTTLSDADLKIVDLEGEKFDPGMAATAVNLSEFKDTDLLIIDQMLDPIVMSKSGLVKTGTVTLKKVTI